MEELERNSEGVKDGAERGGSGEPSLQRETGAEARGEGAPLILFLSSSLAGTPFAFPAAARRRAQRLFSWVCGCVFLRAGLHGARYNMVLQAGEKWERRGS